MGVTLTRRQDAFVTEYGKDGNATQAAIRAGYAPSSAYQRGHELVNNREVQQRVMRLGLLGLDMLEEIAVKGKNDIARVKAATVLVERSFGKAVPSKIISPALTVNFKRV